MAKDLNLKLSFFDDFTAKFRDAMKNAGKQFEEFDKKLKNGQLSRGLSDFGKSAAVVGGSVAASLALPIHQAMEFETAMADVRKAVNALDTEEKFQDMQSEILKLGRSLPLVHTEIAAIVAAGGRMGVPHAELLAFTKDVAKMANAFDMSAGEVGESMGKLATVFNIPYNELSKVGDVINHIADNTSSKEPQIIDAMQRVAGTANQVGLKADQTAAIIASFIHLGKGPETAASAVNALLRELVMAEGQSKKFQGALKTLGLDGKKLQRDMVATPQQTLIDVMERLTKVPKHMQTTIATELFGKEFGDDAALLSTKLDEYKKILNLSTDEARVGSLDKSLEIITNTSAAKLKMVKNQINEVMVGLGNELLPIINDLVKEIKPYIISLTEWIKNNKELTLTILKAAAGFAALSVAASGIAFVFSGVFKVINMVRGVTKFLSIGFKVISPLVTKLGGFKTIFASVFKVLITGFKVLKFVVMRHPVVAVVTAIATAAYLIYKNWDKIVIYFKEKFSQLYEAFSEFSAYLSGNFLNGLRWVGYKIWDLVFYPIIKGLEVVQSGLAAIGIDTKMVDLSAKNIFGEIEWQPYGGKKNYQMQAVPSMPFLSSVRSMNRQQQVPFQISYTPTINITGNPGQEQLQEINKTVKHSGDDLLRIMKQKEQREKEKMY